mmetsp:Transcript_68540/g.198542  ORF Transcript_68540/g.198542 Transcript_68540/m.198542 type:complete len:253 (+) Transcript_68540:136-894(+)
MRDQPPPWPSPSPGSSVVAVFGRPSSDSEVMIALACWATSRTWASFFSCAISCSVLHASGNHCFFKLRTDFKEPSRGYRGWNELASPSASSFFFRLCFEVSMASRSGRSLEGLTPRIAPLWKATRFEPSDAQMSEGIPEATPAPSMTNGAPRETSAAKRKTSAIAAAWRPAWPLKYSFALRNSSSVITRDRSLASSGCSQASVLWLFLSAPLPLSRPGFEARAEACSCAPGPSEAPEELLGRAMESGSPSKA